MKKEVGRKSEGGKCRKIGGNVLKSSACVVPLIGERATCGRLFYGLAKAEEEA